MRSKLKTRNPHSGRNAKRIRNLSFEFPSSFVLRPSDFFLRTLFFLLLLLLPACRRDMFNQPSSKPLSENDFFHDNQMASRPLAMHTVARGHLNEDEAFYTGKIGTNLVTTIPVLVTRELLERGRERYEIYCSVCHGRTGEGNGMIVQRGFTPPPSYHLDRLRTAPAGHFFQVMTNGFGAMFSYSERVVPEDRWRIVAYIRALQLSQNADPAALSDEQRQ